MNHFKVLDNLPILNLYDEFINLLNLGKIRWSDISKDQICINSTKDDPDNFLLGRGNLVWDWDNSYTKNNKMEVEKRANPLVEEDFTELCTSFKNSKFELVYNELSKHYQLGRVRIINSKPKTCLTWHIDPSPRIHYPIKTQEGCFMVIQNEVMHLPQNTWWQTNTTKPHTAFNGSKEDRIHLVAVILNN
jgi:hypothetical protein